MNRGGFSWKRLTGVSSAKSRISRKIGVPLTRSGRQRKLGASAGCSVYIALLAAAILLLAWGVTVAHGASLLTISSIDVGQGDSILVQFPNGQDMLVDAGDQSHGQIVVDYLHSRKVSNIDILVATHPHADHIGGMPEILSSFKIGKVWDSGYNQGSQTQQRFLQTIKSKGIRFGTPRAGFTQTVGDVRVDVLAPRQPLSGTDSDANNSSIVLRLSYGNISFLLTGDMESEERSTIPAWPRSTVLKVAHHGSRNGTDRAFIKEVAPKLAVISVAKQNSYGHPHPETLQTLKDAKVKVLTTADQGTVMVSTDGKTFDVKSLGKTSNGAGNSPASSPSAVNSSGESGQYIGNLRSHIFHRPSCSSLPAEKNRVYFSSRDKAVSEGYRACKRCDP